MTFNDALWSRLLAMELDREGVALNFSDRLRRENGWTRAFTQQAIAEYRKFLYLAATSPGHVTPSDVVDQVWHLHLTYTRAYWDTLCGEILGRPLHHGPTQGGPAEGQRYRDQYAETLALYRAAFGAEAPAAIWPAADKRFSGATHQRWVDTRTHLVISRRLVGRVAGTAIALPALLAGGSALAAESAESIDLLSSGSLLAIAAGVVGLLFLLVMLSGSSRRAGGKDGKDGSGCSTVGYSAGSPGCDKGGKGDADGDGDGDGGCGGGCGD